LTQYNPFLSLQPALAVTADCVIHGLSSLVSAPTRLESTTLILSYGGADVHYTRSSQASGGFDSLKSDFNHPFLLLILAALAIICYVLRSLASAKQLRKAWA
jgi:hypothetical protein